MSQAVQALSHRGVQVLILVLTYLLIARFLPLEIHQGLYTISILIKDTLLWILPLTVGCFIAHTICSFHQKAPLFIFCLLLFEALSNLCSVWYAFGCGHMAGSFLPSISMPGGNIEFSTLCSFPFARPCWWSADKGVFAGIIIGCLVGIIPSPRSRAVISYGKATAEWVLTHIFSKMIPLFITGFVARMYQTHLLQSVCTHYGMLIVWLVLFLAVYICLLFFIGSGFKMGLRALKNLLPAGGIAFSSGCSLSTMPWTIEGTSKNLQNPGFAKAIIPATTNIQQIGDCITNTFLCFLIYKQFFGVSPDFFMWLNFSLVYVLARFTTAAVLGGAIFIMLPVYESYLSFNSEMIAIILAFNVILDPLVTSTNVIANGALCRIFERVWLSIGKKTAVPVPISTEE